MKPLRVLNAKLDIWTKVVTVQYSQPNTQELHAKIKNEINYKFLCFAW